MPRTAEHTVNVELARLLRTRHPRWRQGVGVEQSGVLQDAPGQRPDILIQHPGGLPVVIETEYQPAREVERDASGRLGAVVAATGEAIEQAVALRVPVELRGVNQAVLLQRAAEAAFDYCVFTEGTEGPDRWPDSGWLTGGVDDLAGFIEQTALSERRIARGTLILETGVRQAAGRLQAMLLEPAGILRKRAAVLHQQPGEQTERMAMAIVANALTFHATLAASSRDVRSFDDLRAKSLLGLWTATWLSGNGAAFCARSTIGRSSGSPSTSCHRSRPASPCPSLSTWLWSLIRCTRSAPPPPTTSPARCSAA